jgi:hypothetical protein
MAIADEQRGLSFGRPPGVAFRDRATRVLRSLLSGVLSRIAGEAGWRSRTEGASGWNSLIGVGSSSWDPPQPLRRSRPTHPSYRWWRTLKENQVSHVPATEHPAREVVSPTEQSDVGRSDIERL